MNKSVMKIHSRFPSLILQTMLVACMTVPNMSSAQNALLGADNTSATGATAQGAAAPGIAPLTVAPPADAKAAQLPDAARQTNEPAASRSEADELNRALSKARGPVRNDPPSQFQRFVKEATGTLLPNFGSQLFDAPQNYVPDAGLAAPANYVLGPGDEVRLRVWGAVDFSSNLTIDRNGQVQIPKVGVVNLAGVSLADLEGVLKSQISHTFTNFSLNAGLGRMRSIQVYVVGQARQPGTYAVSSLSTLINALFVSGGPNSNGSMRAIELQRGGKVVTRIDLYDFIARGDKSKDAALMPGDVIFIPPASQRIAVTGAFDQSAIYELLGSTTVGDVLALGGGSSPVASTRKALLERVDPARVPARQVQDLALDAAGLKQAVQGGDSLTLLPVSPAFSNAVTLQGVVAEPLRYRWFEGMKILDLIPDREALITPDYYRRKNQLVQSEKSMPASGLGAGPLGQDGTPTTTSGLGNTRDAGSKVADRFRTIVDQVNWDYAVIERLNRETLTSELIPFNLGRAVVQKDPSQNLALLPGDVVTILNHTDLALPQEKQTRLVRVEGEVAAPGIYRALPGETLPQLIKRIGGLSAQAYLFGTEFERDSVRRQQQSNLETFTRKLEAQLQSRAGAVTSSGGDSTALAQAQAMQLQQQAQLKAQIGRLRALKSSGRMSLELDPKAQQLAALPAVVLEDGDHIVVPATPSFVSALGSVNNENAILYKPGKTVADIIRAAGYTEEAEPDSAFVLRADGSVLSRRDRSSYFGGSFDSVQIMPGDTLVVPSKVDMESSYNFTVRALKDWTQIFANFGLGVVAAKQL